ncbi:MAG: PepSY-associated TM helix domain-containing protein [Parasphingorhabdus sp.]
MKVRTDIVKMYKEVHGWVGITSGLALFIAFYAGAFTMFEEPLQRWASAPSTLAAAPSIERTPELVEKVIAAHPEAAEDYHVNLVIDGNYPARVSWSTGGRGDEHSPQKTYYASLDGNGELQVSEDGPSPVAEFIDVLHQQVGLPFSHEISMVIMGAICLLYCIAIVSGVVVLLPSLVKDLFALRMGKNVKRMWLDMHNVLGLFSIPFHIIMALTAIVFAFHDQFYDAQDYVFGPGERGVNASAPAPEGDPLSVSALVERLNIQAPGFKPVTIDYGWSPDGILSARVGGTDARYGLRGPTLGFAMVNPYNGDITGKDYLPGMQDGWAASVTSFFALHFGNFGGATVRWAYFLLGLAGAMLFFTGNLLWIESRRKKERKAGLPEQTRSTRILGALTVGVPLGCIAGISVTLAAAKLLGGGSSYGLHSAVYYAIFLAFSIGAYIRGPARAGVELSLAAAIATLLIPASSLLRGAEWYNGGGSVLVDITAVVISAVLFMAMKSARKRAQDGPVDSIWAARKFEAAGQSGSD